MLAQPRIGAILIQSGSRKNAYLERQHSEHAYWWEQMQNPVNILQAVAAQYGKVGQERLIAPLQSAATTVKALSRRLCFLLGLWPPHPGFWLRYWRKGTFIRELRRRRGLKPMPRR